MKNSFYIGLILLLIGAICLGVVFNSELSDLKQEMLYESSNNKKEIEDLKKEIRLLNQDIFNLKYGYEVGEE